jgi:hypothetical protein
MSVKINNNLIKSTIKGLEVTCYVVTEEQLENQQRETIWGDLFLIIATVLLGISFSDLYRYLLLFFLGILFLFLFFWFSFLKYSLVKKLKKSPEVKYINFEESNEIEIIKATYGSDTILMDVTEIIKNNLKDNKLDIIVSNIIMGRDPHEKIRKNLEVIYNYNGKIIKKNCLERDRLLIP